MKHHTAVQRILLLSRLLDGRDAASSFVLVQDSLEQPADGLLDEICRRASARNSPALFLAFETIRPPPGATVVDCAGLAPAQILRLVRAALAPSPSPATILIDTLHPLAHALGPGTPAFLTALVRESLAAATSATPTASSTTPSLFAVYHTSLPSVPLHHAGAGAYSPPALTLLHHAATAIVTTHAPAQFLARVRAQLRSRRPPVFGLAEAVDGAAEAAAAASGAESAAVGPDGGVVVGFGMSPTGLVLQTDIRRRGSGRGVAEWYFLGPEAVAGPAPAGKGGRGGAAAGGMVPVLLTAYEPYAALVRPAEPDENGDDKLVSGTFNLELTDRQRESREKVVLPYFDAQRADEDDAGADVGGGRYNLGAIGDGGRILYDMGAEDDFDEEEDEI